MDEINENLRHSLNQAIAGEIRNNETGTMPNFDIAAFSVNFHNATDVNLVPDDDDEQYKDNNTNMEVCRLCLSSDKKLYELSPQIQVAYQCALSQDVYENSDEKLPQKFCWECNARMTSFTYFRMKAIQTNTLLYSLIRPFMSVSELTSTRRQRRAAGLLANPACIIHRQSRTVPYNIPADAEDGLPRRSTGLSFCVLQRPRQTEEPREPV